MSGFRIASLGLAQTFPAYHYYAVLDADDALVAFRCFGTDAQEQPVASFASLHATWRARPLRHAHCRPRPLRYVAFLDYSVALLLRVGGGCAFPHRLLRDHIGALSDADIADLAARDQH